MNSNYKTRERREYQILKHGLSEIENQNLSVIQRQQEERNFVVPEPSSTGQMALLQY